MSKEELTKLAQKIRDKAATKKEVMLFMKTVNQVLEEIKVELKS